MRLLPTLFLGFALALTSVSASAYDLEDALRDLNDQYQERDRSKREYKVAQNNGGKSLSEAIEQVRRKTNGRILSAQTKVKGNREVHHIKVLTEDGKVKTHKVQGRRRGN